MGTRALVRVFDGEKELLCVYRQMDGYPDGLGVELKKFCDGMHVVNGLSGDGPKRVANGAGCLAAQLLAYLKDGPGSVYVYPVGSSDCGEAYTYRIDCPSYDAIPPRGSVAVVLSAVRRYGETGPEPVEIP